SNTPADPNPVLPTDPSQTYLTAWGAYVSVPGSDYEYAGWFYTPGQNGPPDLWTFTFTSTLGPYNPTYPCCDAYIGGTCPAMTSAFVVSSTQPVPLPAALWLLLSGLGISSRTALAIGARSKSEKP